MVISIKKGGHWKVFSNVVMFDYNVPTHTIEFRCTEPEEMHVLHYVNDVEILSY